MGRWIYFKAYLSLYVRQLPIAIKRLFFHCIGKSYYHRPPLYGRRWDYWIGDLIVYLIEVSILPVLVFIIIRTLIVDVRSIRELSSEERDLAMLYFQEEIHYEHVILHTKMSPRIRKLAYAFVMLNGIHFEKKLPPHIFLHEMVHVYQYERYGIVYAFRALMAQRTVEGYDYGGGEGIYQAMITDKRLEQFNFEQQAQIIEDAYLCGEEWASPMLNGVYAHYSRQLVNNNASL